MKIAYADPPYIGQAKKHYGSDPKCAEVNHNDLIQKLCTDFDAWALSCSSPSLFQILPLCPKGTRIAAWVKPFCSFKVGVNPAYAWEPVLFYGVRKRPRKEPTVRDWCSASITLKKGCHGAKPFEFCEWLFNLLAIDVNADSFHDLYYGSGAVSKAYEVWKSYKLGILGNDLKPEQAKE